MRKILAHYFIISTARRGAHDSYGGQKQKKGPSTLCCGSIEPSSTPAHCVHAELSNCFVPAPTAERRKLRARPSKWPLAHTLRFPAPAPPQTRTSKRTTPFSTIRSEVRLCAPRKKSEVLQAKRAVNYASRSNTRFSVPI